MSTSKHVICVFALVVMLLSVGLSQVRQPGVMDSRNIIQRAYAGMGCLDIGNDTTIFVTGSLKLADSQTAGMPITIQSKGSRRWRSEIVTQKGRRVLVVNNGIGQIQHENGKLIGLSAHNTSHQQPTHLPCLTNLASASSEIASKYLRTESLSGDSLDVIELAPKTKRDGVLFANRTKTTLWISRNTGYLMKLEYTNTAENNPSSTELVDVNYADYRVINGIAVPFKQQTFNEGTLSIELDIDSVQFGTSPADFTLR
jgi:outer membrane lipoprotein-sorting protein